MNRKIIDQNELLKKAGVEYNLFCAVLWCFLAIVMFFYLPMIKEMFVFELIPLAIGIYFIVNALKTRNVILNGEIVMEQLKLAGIQRNCRVSRSSPRFYCIFENGITVRCYPYNSNGVVNRPGELYYVFTAKLGEKTKFCIFPCKKYELSPKFIN